MDLFLERLLSHSPLNEEEQAAVASLPATAMDVAAHRDFLRLGERTNHSCLVAKGLVARFGQTETGARQLISIHIPGEMVDLHSLMVQEANAALTALTPSAILQIPHPALREVGLRYPAVAAAFWRDCVLQAAIVAQWLVNVGRRDARARLAHLLCEMALRYRPMGEAPALCYELPMTQEQLGDALGLTAVHVNRMLTSLRDDEVVATSRGFIEILDWKALADAAEFDSTYLNLRNGVAA